MDLKAKKDYLKEKMKQWKNNRLVRFLVILFGVFVIFAIIWQFASGTSSVEVFDFMNPLKKEETIKSTDDRINILLLGNAGGVHDGPYLTDSIIVASYNLKTSDITLFSIPRDLWVDSLKIKVNAVYERGIKTNDALKLAEDKIDDILGIPIHYGIRLDFSGFARAIDLVEGIDVNVEKTFDDYKYPIAGKEDDLCGLAEQEIELSEDAISALNIPSPSPSGMWYSSSEPIKPGKQKVLVDPQGKIATDSAIFNCRFERLSFKTGLAHMDGETALKFVRSRMGTNGEGSDFARSKRQQLVLQSFREKSLSLQTLANPVKVTGLIATFGESIETDIPVKFYLDFYNLAKKIDKVESVVLGDLGKDKSILITPPPKDYGGAFVLVPPNNDYQVIAKFVKEKLQIQ